MSLTVTDVMAYPDHLDNNEEEATKLASRIYQHIADSGDNMVRIVYFVPEEDPTVSNIPDRFESEYVVDISFTYLVEIMASYKFVLISGVAMKYY